ncbi:MAG: signal peptidase II [Bacilli bacterium]|nr:signal peptidase II [Mycoplasmatota bacterium]MDD6264079.1 signal peptidase II [bacterium]MEE0015010.1 signal peptidase II [Bacilli bacterium]
MQKNKNKVYLTSVIVLLIDQIVKLLIKTNMNLNEEISIIPNFFSIQYLKNTGAAFSILENQTILLAITSIICISVIIYYLKKEENLTTAMYLSFGLVLGGILGNLIDRIVYQGVIDFLSFQIFNYNFPVFNIADIGITIGVLLLIIIYISRDIKK